MAKKSMISEATDAVKSVAGAALGAAAIAATGVVVTRVAGAMRKGGKDLEDSAPEIQKLADQTVSKPLLPTGKKKAAVRQRARVPKKKVGARKSAKKSTNKSARKKR